MREAPALAAARAAVTAPSRRSAPRRGRFPPLAAGRVKHGRPAARPLQFAQAAKQ